MIEVGIVVGSKSDLPVIQRCADTLAELGIESEVKVMSAHRSLNGFESLLAIVQMPPGIPVATVAIGEAGARNAAYLAAEIIGLSRTEVAERYQAVRDRFVEEAERG